MNTDKKGSSEKGQVQSGWVRPISVKHSSVGVASKKVGSIFFCFFRVFFFTQRKSRPGGQTAAFRESFSLFSRNSAVCQTVIWGILPKLSSWWWLIKKLFFWKKSKKTQFWSKKWEKSGWIEQISHWLGITQNRDVVYMLRDISKCYHGYS